MRRRRLRKRSKTPAEVELNMAAMLDMAFQLLAFFILTFRPSPIEAQISLRMPDKAATSSSGQSTDQSTTSTGLQLTISVHSTPDGEIAGVEIGPQTLGAGEGPAEIINSLRSTLKDFLANAEFEGISLQVSNDLNYERLMQVLDVCSHQTLPSGEAMTNISISTLASG